MSITKFLEEENQQYYLKEAYGECWFRLMSAIELLDIRDLEHVSNPFLIKALPSYRKAKRKVLFVGRETNGWDSFKTTLDTFRSNDEELKRENCIEYLQWMYEDLRFHRKYDHTPFWKAMRRLYQVVSPGDGDDGFLHTELVRFDYANKRPPKEIEELLRREYNVLHMEIKALSPEIVIFLTGPDYDDHLIKSYHRVGGSGIPLSFESVKDFNAKSLLRVVHSELPYHTYRTYHPMHSLHFNEKAIFEPIEEALYELTRI